MIVKTYSSAERSFFSDCEYWTAFAVYFATSARVDIATAPSESQESPGLMARPDFVVARIPKAKEPRNALAERQMRMVARRRTVSVMATVVTVPMRALGNDDQSGYCEN